MVFSDLRVMVKCGRDAHTTVYDEDFNRRRVTKYATVTSHILSISKHSRRCLSRYERWAWDQQFFLKLGIPESKRHLQSRYTKANLPWVTLVCRQLYQEACLLAYSAPTFFFNSHNALSRWLAQLRPVQRRAIQSIDATGFRPKECHLKDLAGLKFVYEDHAETEEWAEFWEGKGVEVKWRCMKKLI